MPAHQINKIHAVLMKDVRSELRTRYAVSSILLFILTTIAVIVISTKEEMFNAGLASGLLWIIMFFGAMTGLAKSFVSEEERGTVLFLKLTATSTSVYFGKLLFNILLSFTLNTFAVLLFFMFNSAVAINAPLNFIITHIFGCIGLAAAATMIAAIISKANTKGALFPVLAFPILLPLLVIGIESTKFSLMGKSFDELLTNFQIMFAYCGLVITVSYILFSLVWEE